MENTYTIAKRLLCAACLCSGRTLQKVTNKKMKQYYLDVLDEIPLSKMPEMCPSICWECEAKLRKAVAFREQVKESYNILQSHNNLTLKSLLTDVSKPPRLKVRVNSPVNVPPAKVPSNDVAPTNSAPSVETSDFQLVRVKEEVEIEWDNNKDEDLDMTPDLQEQTVEEPECNIKILKVESEQAPEGRGSVTSAAVFVKGEPREWGEEQGACAVKDITSNAPSAYQVNDQAVAVNQRRERHGQALKHITHKSSTLTVKEVQARLYEEKDKTNLYKCDHCESSFCDKTTLISHIASHSNDGNIKNGNRSKYSCSLCDSKFDTKSDLISHDIKIHESKRKYKSCTQCDYKTINNGHFRIHMETHSGIRKYKCNTCTFTAVTQKQLERHKINELNAHTCETCGLKFDNKRTFKNHFLSHKTDRRYTCELCGNKYQNSYHLKRHAKVHSQEKPFACRICDKSYVEKHKLKQHEKKHAGK